MREMSWAVTGFCVGKAKFLCLLSPTSPVAVLAPQFIRIVKMFFLLEFSYGPHLAHGGANKLVRPRLQHTDLVFNSGSFSLLF